MARGSRVDDGLRPVRTAEEAAAEAARIAQVAKLIRPPVLEWLKGKALSSKVDASADILAEGLDGLMAELSDGSEGDTAPQQLVDELHKVTDELRRAPIGPSAVCGVLEEDASRLSARLGRWWCELIHRARPANSVEPVRLCFDLLPKATSESFRYLGGIVKPYADSTEGILTCLRALIEPVEKRQLTLPYALQVVFSSDPIPADAPMERRVASSVPLDIPSGPVGPHGRERVNISHVPLADRPLAEPRPPSKTSKGVAAAIILVAFIWVLSAGLLHHPTAAPSRMVTSPSVEIELSAGATLTSSRAIRFHVDPAHGKYLTVIGRSTPSNGSPLVAPNLKVDPGGGAVIPLPTAVGDISIVAVQTRYPLGSEDVRSAVQRTSETSGMDLQTMLSKSQHGATLPAIGTAHFRIVPAQVGAPGSESLPR
ncbi:MAG: hypothetical protein HY815_24460 [Candidatus Riflebacteria bacterium]|nr:hypothetical protein [Candidatus Riflebacteria bacterium]